MRFPRAPGKPTCAVPASSTVRRRLFMPSAVFLQTGLRRPRLDLLPGKPPGAALAANLQELTCCFRPPSPPPPTPFISLFFLRPGFLPPSAGRLTSSSPLSQGTGALWSPGHRFPPWWGAGLSSHHNTLVNSASNEWPTLLGSCGLRFLRHLSGLWIFSTGG